MWAANADPWVEIFGNHVVDYPPFSLRPSPQTGTPTDRHVQPFFHRSQTEAQSRRATCPKVLARASGRAGLEPRPSVSQSPLLLQVPAY